jgi:hypothetical protein
VIPSVEGILTSRQVSETAASIAAMQEPYGAVPYAAGDHADVWNHVEAAMAMLVGGEVEAAEAAYRWLPEIQRPDGSWPAFLRDGAVEDERSETNNSAYPAVGLWHHWLVRRDLGFVRELWPTVRAGLDWVVSQQQPFGGIRWTPVDDLALLTGSSSIYQSLRAGVALAELVGDPQPGWELAGGRLGHAVRAHPDRFEDKARYSMDWYYPVLGGAVRGADADALIASRWEAFVVPGLGIRCVVPNPWVTGAETCELVLALEAIGDPRARPLFVDVQHLRADDGSYWTGWVFDDGTNGHEDPDVFWPVEHSSYTAAAVVLAADALGHGTPGADIMRGSTLAPRFAELVLDCDCSGERVPGLA